jgi:hypothetical protein
MRRGIYGRAFVTVTLSLNRRLGHGRGELNTSVALPSKTRRLPIRRKSINLVCFRSESRRELPAFSALSCA